MTDAAKVLGVSRHTLSRVLKGPVAISPELAIRLEKAGWSNAEFWLRRQEIYDSRRPASAKTRSTSLRYQPRPTA